MPLNYDMKDRSESLLPVLDEHAEWFNGVMRCSLYPGHYPAGERYRPPKSFAEWALHAERDEHIQPELLEKLSKLHQDLLDAASSLVESGEGNGKGKPDHAVFNAFVTIYEEFRNAIRRLEKDIIREDSGYDRFTGLRSKTLMVKDVEREMHRLARQGKKFSFALTRVDAFTDIQRCYKKSEQDACIRLVADLIKLSIRSFDDAYYLGDDEFVLCLKQTDISGGIAALERLRKELERQNIKLDIDGREVPLSLSCCIAEPVEGDDVHELLKNLRADLRDTDKKADTVLQFFEMSPLQRYVQETSPRR